jgi:hypothetical protein
MDSEEEPEREHEQESDEEPLFPPKIVNVTLIDGFSGNKISGECSLMWKCFSHPEATPDGVAHVISHDNPGGLRDLITTDDVLYGTWTEKCVFILPDTVVPLERFTNIDDHVVQDRNGCLQLTLIIIKLQ